MCEKFFKKLGTFQTLITLFFLAEKNFMLFRFLTRFFSYSFRPASHFSKFFTCTIVHRNTCHRRVLRFLINFFCFYRSFRLREKSMIDGWSKDDRFFSGRISLMELNYWWSRVRENVGTFEIFSKNINSYYSMLVKCSQVFIARVRNWKFHFFKPWNSEKNDSCIKSN